MLCEALYPKDVLQEGPQESIETIVGNIARAVYDGDVEAFDGALESYVQGAVVGAPAGGLIAGLGGRNREDVAVEPTAPPNPVAPAASFEEVFGTGGEDPLAGSQPVDEDVQAAVSAAIREDNVMDDMFAGVEALERSRVQPDLPLEGGGPNAPASVPVTVEQQPGPDVPPGTTIPLPLEQRQRGVPPQDVSGAPPAVAPDAVPDLGTTPTEQQGDFFDPIPQGEPDVPSAEPMGDIQAQLRDLEDPTSDREGVFLSADNLARLERDGLRGAVGGVGVHLPNFDGKGGLLIAENQEVADSVTELRDNGFPMQVILGQVTRAGSGKPPAEGSAVLQVRDDQGNVVRESLLPEEQAFQEAEAVGEQAVVISPQQAQKRRQQLDRAGAGDRQTARGHPRNYPIGGAR